MGKLLTIWLESFCLLNFFTLKTRIYIYYDIRPTLLAIGKSLHYNSIYWQTALTHAVLCIPEIS